MATARQQERARREYLEALDAIDEADVRLREQLRAYRRLRDVSRRHIERGGSAAELRDLMEIKGARSRTDQALRELASTRFRAQCALYRLAASEGMSAAEIGRSWGVSRQLVSRVLHNR
jgi:hypothetical protein